MLHVLPGVGTQELGVDDEGGDIVDALIVIVFLLVLPLAHSFPLPAPRALFSVIF